MSIYFLDYIFFVVVEHYIKPSTFIVKQLKPNIWPILEEMLLSILCVRKYLAAKIKFSMGVIFQL